MMMMMILQGCTLFVCMLVSSILELLRQHEYMNLQAQGLEALAIFRRLSFFLDSGKST
jgi:hypoxanthine-guanine phosphoribosyltransferase